MAFGFGTTAAPRILPESQRARLEAIRDRMLREAQAAIDGYAGPLRAKAKALADACWTHRDNPARIRSIIRRFHSTQQEELAWYIRDMVADAVLYAERYEETLLDFKVRQRLHLPDRPGPGDRLAIGDYETYYRLNYGQPGAEAAAAYAYKQAARDADKLKAWDSLEDARRATRAKAKAGSWRQLHLGEAAKRGPKVVTEADAAAVEHLRPFKGTDGLSKALHGEAVAESREAARVMLRSIRESNRVDTSARELQRLLAKRGARFGANEAVPRLVQELEDAGAWLRHGGGVEAEERWTQVLAEMRHYQRGLKQGGTVQNAYLELLQRVQSPKFQMADLEGCTEQWGYWKERYRAERWIRTEQQTAYRVAQLDKQEMHRWITGYLWVMNGGLHKRYVNAKRPDGTRATPRRPPGKSKKFGGKHCICEVLAGRVLSPEIAREYPGGGHPHCGCSLVPQYDERELLDAPITAEEEAWYQEQRGGG